jgi:hypothetical protein
MVNYDFQLIRAVQFLLIKRMIRTKRGWKGEEMEQCITKMDKKGRENSMAPKVFSRVFQIDAQYFGCFWFILSDFYRPILISSQFPFLPLLCCSLRLIALRLWNAVLVPSSISWLDPYGVLEGSKKQIDISHSCDNLKIQILFALKLSKRGRRRTAGFLSQMTHPDLFRTPKERGENESQIHVMHFYFIDYFDSMGLWPRYV